MNGYLGRVEEMVCATNKSLLLSSKTILSIDDDHIRQRSQKVREQTHLKVVNNPKKAIGPVQTACCSALTSAFIGGHYSVRGESLRATFEKLFMFIQSARHPADIRAMQHLIIAADRGYLSKETVDFITHSLQASFIGTHKRVHGYPFVYGSSGIALKHKGFKIPEKGGRAVFYAKTVSRAANNSRSRAVPLTAVAFRDAVNGRVALFLTSVKEFSTGWSTQPHALTPRSRFRLDTEVLPTNFSSLKFKLTFRAPSTVTTASAHGAAPAFDKVLESLLSQLMPLTVEQSVCKGWFLLRAFRFTSRTSAGYVKVLRDAILDGCDFVIPAERELVDMIYGSSVTIPSATDEQKEREWCMRELIERQRTLKSMYVPELNRILKGLGLALSGRKVEKIIRLEVEACRLSGEIGRTGRSLEDVAREESETNQERKRVTRFVDLSGRLQKVAFQSWVLKPTVRDNEDMMFGRMNEPIVLQKLYGFLHVNRSPFQLHCIFETGLVSRKQSSYNILADSPDGIGLFKSVDEGAVFSVDLTKPEDLQVYRECTLQNEYRLQCMHHAAVLGVRHVVLVVATPRYICYAARLYYPDELIQNYVEYLFKVRSAAFSWIGKAASDIPPEVLSVACPDDDGTKVEGFLSFYGLCMSVTKFLRDRDAPLPPQKQIRPIVALAWNALKGGTDEFSRALSLLKVEIMHSHPNCKYIMRFILSQVYNACVAYRVVLADRRGIIEREMNRSYRELRKRITNQTSLTAFVRRLIDDILGKRDKEGVADYRENADVSSIPLRNRFARNVLQSFRLKAMWYIRSRGSHILKQQPRKLIKKDGEVHISKRFRKACAVCSNATSRDAKLKKPGRKTCWICERCQVPLCNPNGKGKEMSYCWNWFHQNRHLEFKMLPTTEAAQSSEQPQTRDTSAGPLDNANTNFRRSVREQKRFLELQSADKNEKASGTNQTQTHRATRVGTGKEITRGPNGRKKTESPCQHETRRSTRLTRRRVQEGPSEGRSRKKMKRR